MKVLSVYSQLECPLDGVDIILKLIDIVLSLSCETQSSVSLLGFKDENGKLSTADHRFISASLRFADQFCLSG